MRTVLNDIWTQLKTKVEGVSTIASVYDYPVDNISEYPSAVILLSTMDSQAQTLSDDIENYSFTIFVASPVDQSTMHNVYRTIMAQVYDDLKDAIDGDWEMPNVSGSYRAWADVASADYGVYDSEKGMLAMLQVTVNVRLVI